MLGKIRARVMRDRAVILLYHRVTDCEDLIDYAPNGIAVRPETFEAHIKYLVQRYNLISLSELTERLNSPEPLPKNTCVVTFDDGWRDNYDTAFPILQRYGVPATIFLATNFVEGGTWFWEERAKYLLAHIYSSYVRGGKDVRGALASTCEEAGVGELTRLARISVPGYLTEIVNTVRCERGDNGPGFVDELEKILATHGLTEPRRFLNWEEVRKMSLEGIEFGMHTKSHTSLTGCSEAQIEEELQGSRDAVYARLKNTSGVFAYPYGKTNAAVRRSVLANGYRCACTTELGRVDKHTDQYGLPRIDIRQAVSPTPAFLECRMLGLLGIY